MSELPSRIRGEGNIQAHAGYLDAHLRKHYPALFQGVAALIPANRLLLQAADAEAARRWLGSFGPDFCGWPLELSTPRDPR